MAAGHLEQAEIAFYPPGQFASAIAKITAENGRKVNLIFRKPEAAARFNRTHRTDRFMGLKQPDSVSGTADKTELRRATAVFFSPPASVFQQAAEEVLPYIPPETDILIGTKGINISTLSRMSPILLKLNPYLEGYIGVLAGPTIAEEIGAGKVTGAVIAAYEDETARRQQLLFATPKFRIYREGDIAGVEYAAALAKVMSVIAGMANGLRVGRNSEGFLFTRSVEEMVRIGEALETEGSTFYGLAGLGDLRAAAGTRNYQAGALIIEGKTILDIEARGIRAEGLYTIRAVNELIREKRIDAPICSALNSVLYENLSISEAVSRLMGRELTEENRRLRSLRYYGWKAGSKIRRFFTNPLRRYPPL